MKQVLNLILALTFHVMVVNAQVNWQSGAGGVEWAFACDFVNHDMGSAQVPGEQCGGKCMSTSGCTHFAWTNYQGGTCWMKSGSVQKSDAKFNNNYQMVCGITPSTNPNPGPNGDGGISEANFRFLSNLFCFNDKVTLLKID